tara:strand:+ start:2130 stop:2345 length:216 start_codon:yes stop_codon:yes gene_type:complete
MNNLKIFLLRNYGSMRKVSDKLSINEATVRSWCEARPRNMMKHLPEISTQCDASYAEIVAEVMERESELNN